MFVTKLFSVVQLYDVTEAVTDGFLEDLTQYISDLLFNCSNDSSLNISFWIFNNFVAFAVSHVVKVHEVIAIKACTASAVNFVICVNLPEGIASLASVAEHFSISIASLLNIQCVSCKVSLNTELFNILSES